MRNESFLQKLKKAATTVLEELRRHFVAAVILSLIEDVVKFLQTILLWISRPRVPPSHPKKPPPPLPPSPPSAGSEPVMRNIEPILFKPNSVIAEPIGIEKENDDLRSAIKNVQSEMVARMAKVCSQPALNKLVNGETVLHLAVKKTIKLLNKVEEKENHSEPVSREEVKKLESLKQILSILIETGARDDIKDKEEKTARDYASEVSGKEVDDPIKTLINKVDSTVTRLHNSESIVQPVKRKKRKKKRTVVLASGDLEIEEEMEMEKVKA